MKRRPCVLCIATLASSAGIDGGGSVRVPAALCGLVALKPTTGRTSHLGCPENAFSIMSIGPIAATVGDAMLINAVISNAGVLAPPACHTQPVESLSSECSWFMS